MEEDTPADDRIIDSEVLANAPAVAEDTHRPSLGQILPFPDSHPRHGFEKVMSNIKKTVEQKRRHVKRKVSKKNAKTMEGKVKKHASGFTDMFSGIGISKKTKKGDNLGNMFNMNVPTLALLAGAGGLIGYLIMKKQ
jgi:hypothetical protein